MSKLFKPREAAEILQVDVSTLNRLAATKQIAFVHLGGKLKKTRRYKQEHIDEFLNSREQKVIELDPFKQNVNLSDGERRFSR